MCILHVHISRGRQYFHLARLRALQIAFSSGLEEASLLVPFLGSDIGFWPCLLKSVSLPGPALRAEYSSTDILSFRGILSQILGQF